MTAEPARRPFPERAASAALATLLDVGGVGFTTWWGSLAPLRRDDIVDELVDAIRGQHGRATNIADPDRTPPPGGSGVSPPPSPAAEHRRTTALDAAARVYQGRGGTLTQDQQGVIVRQAQAFEAYLRGDQDDALDAEVTSLRAKLAMPCGSCHPCMNWSAESMRRLLLDVLADPNGCHLAEGLRERVADASHGCAR